MSKTGFSRGDILIPKGVDLNKWSVVACDQYTSQRDYWEDVKNYVNGSASAFNIVFPEIYLEDNDKQERISKININMQEYLDGNIFKELKGKYIYVERTQRDGRVRCGIIGIVDLEEYDYKKGSQSLIRATEGTVLDRLPPRVDIRRNARLEAPHIMLLIDDPEKSVIEPLCLIKDGLEPIYDTQLMKDGGSVKGFIVDERNADKIDAALSNLADRDNFNKKYGVEEKGVLLFAAGDGNHSLAAAKMCYENLKKECTEAQAQNSPARYALVEVVNLHSDALEFEPIHRVLFDADAGNVIKSLEEYYEVSYEKCDVQSFEIIDREKRVRTYIKNPSSNLAAGTLQKFLDDYINKNGGRLDYIHGEDTVLNLVGDNGGIGFLLPAIKKQELFKTVILDGTLPRKTFSMGHAWDKRYYLECRKIK